MADHTGHNNHNGSPPAGSQPLSRRSFLKKSLGTAGLIALSAGLPALLNGCSRRSDPKFRERAAKLIDQMTLEEKITQLGYDAPAIPRLDIPSYNWWNECLHGVARAGKATVFPQAIGMAASWNTVLMHRIGDVIATEARAKHEAFVRRGKRGLYMGLTFFTPNINIVRDPRWGRGQETYGEDPHLTGQMAKAFITGLQGDDPDYYKVIATSKHFAVHSGPESLRHEFNAEVDDRDLWETYLPAFETTVREAGVASVMCAYNRFRDEPCCGSNPLLDAILRKQWDFDGYVVSDCWAISDFYNEDFHHITDSPKEAAAMALKAGTDLNCGVSYERLGGVVKQGLVSKELVDHALQRLFEARLKLGLLGNTGESPYAGVPYEVVGSGEHRGLALQMARESIVLLKNEPFKEKNEPLLPLSEEINSIAVIGPNADNPRTMLGNYHGTPPHTIGPLEGLRKIAGPDKNVLYARGCDIAEGVYNLEPVESGFLRPSKGPEPLEGHELSKGLYAEYYANKSFENTPAFTRVDAQVDFTWLDDTPVAGTMADTFSVRWSGRLYPPVTGNYEIGFNGMNAYRLYLENELILEEQVDHEPREASFKTELVAGESYKIVIEYVNTGPDPQAHLVWNIPGRDLLSEAKETALQSDLVVLCLGLNASLEGEQLDLEVDGFEGGDRTHLQLPAVQRELMREIHKLEVPIVLVLMSGSALAVNWADEQIPAIVQAWYGGQEGGKGLADVLLGDYNPSGRLPVTWYMSVDDLPPFTDYRMDGRTYRYFKGEVLYPFGHGLSYTEFEYGNLQLHPESKVFKAGTGSTMDVSLDVTNTGERAGEEVVQLYLQYPGGPDPRLLKELKGFEKIHLKPGETVPVSFTLDDRAFLRWDEKAGEKRVYQGELKAVVGRSAGDIRVEEDFLVKS